MAEIPRTIGVERTAPWAAGTDGRHAQVFPTLTERQIEEIQPLGRQRNYRAGELLWNVGDRGTDFYVVLDGELEIVRRDALGTEEVIVTHTRGRFSGETVTLSGRAALVAGRAATDLTVIAVPAGNLRELVTTHAALSELIMRSFILRRMRMIAQGVSDLLLVGSRHCADTLRLQEFLTRNGHPFAFIDVEEAPDVYVTLERFRVGLDDIPLVLTSDGRPLRNPSSHELAERLGISVRLEPQTVYDVAIAGAGPAGLAAAVYAASEGLSVLVLEPVAPGGQAGTSSKIENYLGFPTGISGQALAGRAYTQAQKFGAKVAVPRRLVAIRCGNPYHELELDEGQCVRARSIVIASGARYRKPPLANLSSYEGVGVYYGATYLEAQLCRDQEVAIIGGGNSAGQAAVYLAEQARHVYVIVRSGGLAETMSRYLVRRIETTPNIDLVTRSECVRLEGAAHLEHITWRNKRTGAEIRQPVRHLFIFIGAEPNTDFLPGSIAVDDKGFIVTGPRLMEGNIEPRWPLARTPLLLETSCPGIFAVGDVRSGSVKRVASAVGEGAVVVPFIHEYLS